ncbi:hypothetical protein OEA41_002701 [Lepraria neglecta]|uniref:Uncharacterized protein n=1 Tax=Lepraria neglecta TaxID=209136 RepID=A0AAE0DIP2_9LECA|nr:hypothetical protein OEA41_002701 [Lepraria neglecta]
MDLEHEDLLAVEVMIWFIYFGKYPHFQEAGEDSIFGDLRVDAHIKVYALAKKYDISALALLAKKHFMHGIKWRWWTCLFLHCIPFIYETTPESDGGLRRLLATPRDQKNKFCYLQVQTSRDPWAASYYIAHARFGNVGEAGKVERPGETQEEAIREFRKISKKGPGWNIDIHRDSLRRPGTQTCRLGRQVRQKGVLKGVLEEIQQISPETSLKG